MAIIKANWFLHVMQGEEPNICQRMNQAVAETIATNRQILLSIIKIIIFCGRYNISLRGHWDSALDVARDTEHILNHGNFWALVSFRVDAGDTVLAKHLESARKMPLTLHLMFRIN